MNDAQVINNELPAGSGTFFLDNNRANVGMGTISPYWLQDLGRVGTMTLRVTRGRVVHDDRGIHTTRARIGSPLWSSTVGFHAERLDGASASPDRLRNGRAQ